MNASVNLSKSKHCYNYSNLDFVMSSRENTLRIGERDETHPKRVRQVDAPLCWRIG